MRPTNFCHLNDTANARTSCVPGSLRDFHRVDTPRSLGLRAAGQGTECFTALGTLRRITAGHTLPCPSNLRVSRRGALGRGRSLSTAPIAIEPLTPLSPLPTATERSVPLRAAFSSERVLFRFALSSVRHFSVRGSRQGRRDHRLVKGNGS